MQRQTEKEKMLAGELYVAAVPELVADRKRVRRLTRLYNQTTDEQTDEREATLRELLGRVGSRIEIEPAPDVFAAGNPCRVIRELPSP